MSRQAKEDVVNDARCDCDGWMTDCSCDFIPEARVTSEFARGYSAGFTAAATAGGTAAGDKSIPRCPLCAADLGPLALEVMRRWDALTRPGPRRIRVDDVLDFDTFAATQGADEGPENA